MRNSQQSRIIKLENELKSVNKAITLATSIIDEAVDKIWDGDPSCDCEAPCNCELPKGYKELHELKYHLLGTATGVDITLDGESK